MQLIEPESLAAAERHRRAQRAAEGERGGEGEAGIAGAEQPVVAVLALSDSFEDIWPRISRMAGAEPRIVESVGELAAVPNACAIVVAAGGAEIDAITKVSEVRDLLPTPVAVVGAALDYRVVASLLHAGARDYFAMPMDLGLLSSWIGEGVARVQHEIDRAALHAFTRAQYDFSAIVGASDEIRQAIARAARVIPRGSATVLLTGETGTGKELFAQAIHFNGPRAKQPFVEINCTALPGTLLESELFGHEKGAYTDARTTKPGLFEIAHGGTLFLDEIGDLPLELQPKLLKVLETGRVRRLGGVRESKVNFRIIAATHVDLEHEVSEGRFREDLYFRLNVVRIHLPPLRERKGDVLVLAARFVEQCAKKHGMRPTELTAEAKQVLQGHPWPGNVRELKNAIERALLLGDGEIAVDELIPADPDARLWGDALIPGRSLREINRRIAERIIERYDGNKSLAARALQISRKYLYTLLEDE